MSTVTEQFSENGCSAIDLDLPVLWEEFGHRPGRREAFLRHLRETVRDPGAIDDISFCDACGVPAWDDDLSQAAGGRQRICNPCWDNWTSCDSCDERYPADDLTETLDGADVCETCLSDRFSWCERCDGYYPDSGGGHDHDCCCSSPQRKFKVRNDGCEPLANDTKVTVSLPSGAISAEGLDAISRYLYLKPATRDLSYDLTALGDQWQTRTGNYAKRLSRFAYQEHQVKLTPEVLSQVGCIARDHCTESPSIEIEVTRDLNQSAGYFYHESSCWWSGESESRCALKTNGGFGMRSFGYHGYVSGRAWVMPLRLAAGYLTPTFETLTPDAFVVFNGYGELSGYAAPRILAHMTGWTYRKFEFSCAPMYVNAGGYLVAPEHIAEKYGAALELDVPAHANLFEEEFSNA